MAKVAIVGSGGREHALGWKIGQNEQVSEVIYAPGNAGTEEEKGRNVDLDVSKGENFPELLKLIEKEDIGMVIVGPEAPLAKGLVDYLNNAGYDRVFGPSQAASALEADKFFSYDIMNAINIPQAESIRCSTTANAMSAIEKIADSSGVVIKARGLTGGKGVTVCDSAEQALKEITQHSEDYGPEVLIAERLYGQEFSVFGISDGNKVVPLEIAIQDHKPLLDGDLGPNTGGMGAYGPAPIAPTDVVRSVCDNVMTPVIQEMKRQGTEYKGFLYAGMIMTEDGPKVIEFNIRFGDPECQPGMMKVKDIYIPISYALEGKLDEVDIQFNPGAACCVVMASNGYPGDYKKGLKIGMPHNLSGAEGVKVFHAGTAMKDGELVTAGGRVLGVTALRDTLASAKEMTDQYVGMISHITNQINDADVFVYRKDIGAKALDVA